LPPLLVAGLVELWVARVQRFELVPGLVVAFVDLAEVAFVPELAFLPVVAVAGVVVEWIAAAAEGVVVVTVENVVVPVKLSIFVV
jgi:hypothetical protein